MVKRGQSKKQDEEVTSAAPTFQLQMNHPEELSTTNPAAPCILTGQSKKQDEEAGSDAGSPERATKRGRKNKGDLDVLAEEAEKLEKEEKVGASKESKKAKTKGVRGKPSEDQLRKNNLRVQWCRFRKQHEFLHFRHDPGGEGSKGWWWFLRLVPDQMEYVAHKQKGRAYLKHDDFFFRLKSVYVNKYRDGTKKLELRSCRAPSEWKQQWIEGKKVDVLCEGRKLEVPGLGDLVMLDQAGMAFCRAVVYFESYKQFVEVWPWVESQVGCSFDEALTHVSENQLERGEGYLILPEFLKI